MQKAASGEVGVARAENHRHRPSLPGPPKAMPAAGQPTPGWKTRLELEAEKSLIYQVQMKRAMANPGTTITHKEAKGYIGASHGGAVGH